MDDKNGFLLKEYELCFKQLKFYDERHSSTLKYLLTLTSSIGTAQLALYKISGNVMDSFYKAQFILSIIVFIASFILYLIMLQNRVYFIKIAKQINSLRSYFCQNCPDFTNQLWIDPEMPYFRILSVHTFQMLGAVAITSIFLSIGFHALCSILMCSQILIKTSIFYVIMVFVLSMIGIAYLKNR